MEKVIIDAQALFYLQKSEIPQRLEDLRNQILNGEIIAIIPTIVIAEILWKMRKWKKIKVFNEVFNAWKESPNIIIDSFDLKILDYMAQNETNYELHDEIIAMTCRKHETNVIYTKDNIFKDIFGLKIVKC